MTIFRSQEFPDHFQFKSQYEDEAVPIEEGTVVGIALPYLKVLDSSVDELIEDYTHLIWEQGSVSERRKRK
jgi:hypothetical protein